MRTTVDLPPDALRRVEKLARQRGQSISRVLADLTLQALTQLDLEVTGSRDRHTGFPMISVGRPVTDADVQQALDDE